MAFLLLISAFAPLAVTTGPTQPDPGTGMIDTTTLYVGRAGWGPRRADTVRANDEYSQELIFNVYDRLIMFGEPVSNFWKPNWDVEEQYWAFEPSLAINVPSCQEVIMYVMNVSFVWTIIIRNETAVPFDMRGLWNTTCTWWEDDLVMPTDSYHITDWIDTNDDSITNPCDYLFINEYWWAPSVPQEVVLKRCGWWHVTGVTREINEDMIWKLSLEYVSGTFFDPAHPECTWLKDIFVSPLINKVYHINGWVDNNPDGQIGYCDVVYLEEYNNVTVPWGWTLVPITKRTWHILDVDLGSTVTLHLHHYYYDFIMRTTPVIYFYNEIGGVEDTFDIYDAEYSFKRGLVQDQIGSPMWKFYKPFFDQMNSDYWDTGDPADAIELAYLINDTVEIVSLNPPVLRINLGIPFPDGKVNKAFLQIMCGTWASIVSREFSMGIGCWNGDLFTDLDRDCLPDWWTTYRRKSRTPYDTVGAYRYCGTGPYYVKVFDSINLIVVLERNAGYWRGWPPVAPTDRKAFLQRIDIEYIADWAPRRDAFIACQLDICDVPRANMSDLLNEYGEPKYPEMITIKNIVPVLTLDAVVFTFTVDPRSAYLFSGHFPNGIPPDFFNNIHVRKAFAYSFDHQRYIYDVWMGEAECRETPDIDCLVPDYYTKGPDPPYTYNIDYHAAEVELIQAIFNETSVWNSGFTLGMTYTAGNEEARIACQMISTFFVKLSTYDNRIGPPFTVEISEIDSPTYLTYFEESKLPVGVMRWHGDYADADDFKRPFMHSRGYFAYPQNYTTDNGWPGIGPVTQLPKDILIDLAVKTPDADPNRAKYYADLDSIYIADCPSFPIVQAVERKWTKYWVKGWYYNALYPSNYYYYKLYKEQACWYDVTSDDVGVPEVICNMRDIGYIAQHFQGVAPNPAAPIIYDPFWAPGVYGCGGCDCYGDRIIDMHDIGYACQHFGHTTEP